METRKNTNQFDLSDKENKETAKNKEETIKDDRFPLDKLPHDTLKKDIGEFLSPLDQKYLTLVDNKKLYSLFKGNIKPANDLIEQFLSHIVHGEKDQAEEMLKKDPRLLLHKRIVTDYSGRKIHGAGLQIAEGAEDISINEKEEMVEMIKRYLMTLPEGELEILNQQKEQFPDGWEEKEKERVKNDSEALKKVISAIADSNTDQNCEAALNEFRNYLKPKGIIITGKHFNAQLLIEALNLYAKNYDRFGGWDSRKNNLAWCKVVGYIERFLPTCLAQALCDENLDDLLGKKKQLGRSLKMDNGGTYYPLDSDSSFQLGEHFGVYNWAQPRVVGCMIPWWVDRLSLWLKKYVEQKQTHLVALSLDLAQRRSIGLA